MNPRNEPSWLNPRDELTFQRLLHFVQPVRNIHEESLLPLPLGGSDQKKPLAVRRRLDQAVARGDQRIVPDQEFGCAGLEVARPRARVDRNLPDLSVSTKEQTPAVSTPAWAPSSRDEVTSGLVRIPIRLHEDLLRPSDARLVRDPAAVGRKFFQDLWLRCAGAAPALREGRASAS